MLKGKRIGFIGGGAMAEAIIRGILAVGLLEAAAVFVTDANEKRRSYLRDNLGVNTYQSNEELVQNVDIIFLAVKPQVVDIVLREAAPCLSRGQLLVSIAAGVATRTLENYLSENQPVIRVMPNTPVLVREGATAVAKGRYAEKAHEDLVMEIFGAVGRAVAVPEELMDAVTGLSGSGPAYVCLVIEALADGGVRAGLPRSTALTLAAQTLLGTAKLLLETGQHPGLLKDMVTSPGGTTIAGVHALEEGGLRAALMNGVAAAAERSQELGKHK